MTAKLGPVNQLRTCYETGPTGYVLYWQLTTLGVDCQVVAPTLGPVNVGDRVKTDRRDTEKLARCHRAGDLTPVWVLDAAAHEALRDLVRAREAGKRSAPSQAPVEQVSAPAWPSPADGHEGVDQKASGVGPEPCAFRQPALAATLSDYFHEIEHAAARIER